MLACLVEDLLFKGKEKEAMSVWYRHKEVEEQVEKEDAKKWL